MIRPVSVSQGHWHGRYLFRYRGVARQAFRLIGAVLVLACFAFAGSPDPMDSGFLSGDAGDRHGHQSGAAHGPVWDVSDIPIPIATLSQSRLHSAEDIWGRIRVRRVPNLGRLARAARVYTGHSAGCAAPPVRIASLFSQTGPRTAIGRSPPRVCAGWVA